MKEWLLKEEKSKVGRPKLADSKVLKNAKITMTLGFVMSLFFCFCFLSILKGTTVTKLAYSVTIEKLFGAIDNKDGFLVKEYYDDNSDYVMEFKIPSSIYSYSGNYQYTVYELDGKKWKEKETKTLNKEIKNFKVKIKSCRNKNKTWKIKLQILNASKINKSYAPGGWSFVDSQSNINKYAYKIFTVKGYYSPVSINEYNETLKKQDKIKVTTPKKNPREFIISFPNGCYNVKVNYTDQSSKSVVLANDHNICTNTKYYVPNMNKSSKVTIKIYGKNLNDIKLSNWEISTDNLGKSYIINSYILKPEKAYKNQDT